METTIENVWTRGKKYWMALVLNQTEGLPDTYMIREYVNGRRQGFASLGNKNLREATDEFQRRIDDANTYDGIAYVLSSLYGYTPWIKAGK